MVAAAAEEGKYVAVDAGGVDAAVAAGSLAVAVAEEKSGNVGERVLA